MGWGGQEHRVLAELQGFRAEPILAAWPTDPPAVPAITTLSIRLAGTSTTPDQRRDRR